MARKFELAPIEHWTPSNMLEEMEHFLRDRTMDMDRFWPLGLFNTGYRVPAIDVKEDENRFLINADLPGMTKDDVSIEVGEGIIDISAKKEQETEESGEGYIRKERGSMLFHRRLVLPEGVDADKIQAKLVDGVLEVEIPKLLRPEPQKKKVDVQ